MKTRKKNLKRVRVPVVAAVDKYVYGRPISLQQTLA